MNTTTQIAGIQVATKNVGRKVEVSADGRRTFLVVPSKTSPGFFECCYKDSPNGMAPFVLEETAEAAITEGVSAFWN